jgi:antitoxin PrlF
MQLHYSFGMDDKKPLVSAESTLTDRYQTTIPEVVRKALGLGKRDKLEFLLDETGAVRIKKAERSEEHSDPLLSGFLNLLEKDIDENPQHLRELDDAYFERWQKLLDLMGPIEPYDPDQPLEKDDDDDTDDWLYPSIKK